MAWHDGYLTVPGQSQLRKAVQRQVVVVAKAGMGGLISQYLLSYLQVNSKLLFTSHNTIALMSLHIDPSPH